MGMPPVTNVYDRAVSIYSSLATHNELQKLQQLDPATYRKLDQNGDGLVVQSEFVPAVESAAKNGGSDALDRLGAAIDARATAEAHPVAGLVAQVLVAPIVVLGEVVIAGGEIAAGALVAGGAIALAVLFSAWWLLLLAVAVFLVADGIYTLARPKIPDDPITVANEAVERSLKTDLKTLIDAMPSQPIALRAPTSTGVSLARS
jgi:hypothetical protein